MMNKLLVSSLLLSLIFFSCKSYTPEQKEYITSVQKDRADKDDFMKNSPDSPFNGEMSVHFSPLKYYDVKPEFVFKSKLYEFGNKDTVKIFGTKGEERKAVKYGFVKINFNGKSYNMNVYKGTSRTGIEYYSIWFTDKTTGKDTYGVGRYLDFELNPDKEYVYTIDFNRAYNPYCSYSPKFSCAIPTKEDHIDIAVEAGEKNFH